MARRGDLGRAEAVSATGLDVVTGAFSYTGRYIAAELLARGRRVRTLARRPAPPEHPLAGKVEAAPLVFDESVERSLRGADTLYNTYWVRFERGPVTFARAVENTSRLVEAARRAGVRRVVHVSVANANLASPFPYFRGKAQTEEAVRSSGLSYAIVRPTLVFGGDDVLVSNIAWGLRHVPLFLVPGNGRYAVQPVSVVETAAICVEAGLGDADVTVDAAGPARWTFEQLVGLIRGAVGSRAWVTHAPANVALAAAWLTGLLLDDVLVTRDELGALAAELLVSQEPPRGAERFDAWVEENGDTLGRRYTSELARNFAR
jgi:uncharacterized protein YbjT (DUF2867 family)